MTISKEELIELISDSFNEYLEEGMNKSAAVETIIHEMSQVLVENEKNQLIAHELFVDLLKEEANTPYFKGLTDVVTHLKAKEQG